MFWGKGFMSSGGIAALPKVVGKSFDAKPRHGRKGIKVVAQNLEGRPAGGGERRARRAAEQGGREGPRHKKRRRTREEEWSVAA